MYQTNKRLQSLAYKNKKSRLVVEGSEKVTLEVETSTPLLYLSRTKMHQTAIKPGNSSKQTETDIYTYYFIMKP